MRPTHVKIDKSAFLHNLKKVKEFAPNSSILACLKANAYGHGIFELLAHDLPIDIIGLSCIEEALEIRKSGYNKPILLMEGFFNPEELQLITQYNLQIVVHQQEQIEAIERTEIAKPLIVWFKINSGMNRLGFPPENAMIAWEKLNRSPKVQEPLILMTHFASADEEETTQTLSQLDLFTQITNKWSGKKSLANSAALINHQTTQADYVRPGIMLYGISPFNNKTGLDFGLKPVMSFYSRLIAVQRITKGSIVGYGGTWQSPEDMTIGVVAVGYGDGYPRHARNGTPVLINGKIVPLVGRVSMDMLTVDLRTQPEAKIGDPVTLWGEGLPIEKIASAANTVGYELVCKITNRVRKSS